MNQENAEYTHSQTSGLAIAALVCCVVAAPVGLIPGIILNDDNTIACEARGDLDGDGQTSLFRKEGTIENGIIRHRSEIFRELPLE